MNIKALAVLTGLGGSLAIAAPAPATFLGIVADVTLIGNLDPNDPDREFALVNLYAAFDNEDDQLVIVFGEAGDDLTIETDAPGGYWNPFNGSLPPRQDLIDVLPVMVFDSYMTVGTKRNTIPFGPINGNDASSPYQHFSLASLIVGFDPLPAFGTSNIIHTSSGGVFAVPLIAGPPGPPGDPDLPKIKTPQTLAGPDGLVLFAQLSITSTTDGVPFPEGGTPSRIFGIVNVGVQEKIGRDNVYREIRGIEIDFPVTAPVCPHDLNDDGFVGISDLLILFAAWGTNPGGPPDFNGDTFVGVGDMLSLFANAGPCP